MDLEERYLEMLQKLNVGIVIHAPDARVVFSNRRASELLGFTEDELKGRISPEPERHFVDENGEMALPTRISGQPRHCHRNAGDGSGHGHRPTG